MMSQYPLRIVRSAAKRTVNRGMHRRLQAGVAAAAGAVSVIALLALGGCSQPATTSVGAAAVDTKRALVGYEKIDYIYPIKVPGSNRIVEMRTREPLDYTPTYEDYLKWKENR